VLGLMDYPPGLIRALVIFYLVMPAVLLFSLGYVAAWLIH
jgi:phage shock protein PspC (stress-responsive transcriptional regulator)